MLKVRFWVMATMLVAGVVGCSGDDGDGGAGSAAHICQEQIACGYQATDQASCEQLFAAFFSPAQIAECDRCVSAQECATEQQVCKDACTL